MINISNKDGCVDNKVVNHQNYLVEENRLHFVVDSGRGTTTRTASIFDTRSRTAWYG
jgi:bacillopeptidase F (M6 metalloprotease family)